MSRREEYALVTGPAFTLRINLDAFDIAPAVRICARGSSTLSRSTLGRRLGAAASLPFDRAGCSRSFLGIESRLW